MKLEISCREIEGAEKLNCDFIKVLALLWISLIKICRIELQKNWSKMKKLTKACKLTNIMNELRFNRNIFFLFGSGYQTKMDNKDS